MTDGPARRLAKLLRAQSQRPFIRDVASVAILRLGGGFLLFLSQILLAKWMGPEHFGIYSYAWAWVAVLGTLAGVGFTNTSVRFLAKYRAENAPARARGLLRFGRVLTLTVSIVITLIAWLVVSFTTASSAYSSALHSAFLAIPALALLNLDAAYARGMGWMTGATIAEQIGRPLLLVSFGWLLVGWYGTSSAEAFALLAVFAYLVAALIQHFLVSVHARRVTGTGAREVDVRVWTSVSAFMLLLSGAQMIKMNVDLLLLGSLLPPTEVGVYTAAMRTATLVSFILTVTSVVAQPRLSALHSLQQQARLKHFVTTTTRGIFLLSLAAGAFLCVFGKAILELFGGDYARGYPVLVVLVAGHVLAAAFGPVTSLLTMTGHEVAAAGVHLLSAGASALLIALLAPSLGIFGAAIAGAATLVLSQVALAVLVRRHLSLWSAMA
jgi:O-antigen/teichoic acid export membrane protein